MYKQLINSSGQISTNMIYRIADGAYIPFDEANTDYQAYLKFLADGGTPLPAESN